MALTKTNLQELIAPEAELIDGGPADGVPPLPDVSVNATGARAPSPELIFFRQGYQRGWTEAASVRLMKLEAMEQGIQAVDPEWPLYPTPTPKGAPCPAYVEEKYKSMYKRGYCKGWEASSKHKTAQKLFKTLIIAKAKKSPVKKPSAGKKTTAKAKNKK